MNKLTRSDLMPLERYAAERAGFRAKVIAHKKLRALALGAHASLLFEDRLTVQYQVQEMLRIERIFEASGIQGELDAYNPLIPDGGNLKATLLLEFSDPVERADRLAQLVGIERRVYAEVAGFARVFAHADEGLDRKFGEKSSAVHFLRFEFLPDTIAALRAGANLSIGIDDARLPVRSLASEATRLALLADFSLELSAR